MNYWCRINYGAGRREWKSTGQATLKLARDVVRLWQKRDARGEHWVEKITLAEAAEKWLESKEDAGSEWLRISKIYAGHWKKRFKPMTPLRELTKSDMEGYFRARKEAGASERTRNNERTALKAFFSWALDQEGWIIKNPMARIKRVKEPTRRIQTLQPDEEKRLLMAAKEMGAKVYGTVLTLLMSGLRRGTVAKLTWQDIDFRRNEWRIPAEKMKSDEDFTDRPIAPELLSYLKEIARTSGICFGRIKADDWKATIEAADLPRLKPHDLRRNFVTRCRRAGIPLEVCMHLSDHRDANVILKIYRAVGADEAREAIEKVFGA